MRLSLNWLKDFVQLTVAARDLAEKLTMAGLEVEAVAEVTPPFSGVVVARVTAVEPHPNADRLKIAAVDDGARTYLVVCGAPNVRADRLYAFAPPGALIAGGHQIKPAKLRGVVSQGMLLAEDELGVSPDHEGLMEIPQDLPLGADLAAALDLADVVLEVAVTANRPDCLSMLGLAREVAALLTQPLRHPEARVPAGAGAVASEAKVTILEPVHCPRYAARLLTGLTVKPSPFWLRRRLQLAGLRPINNLVDVTNYVLLEYGQPLHAFDFQRLRGGEIVVRLPRDEERTFVTLDGQERALDAQSLLICDALRPVALAGIMGGLDSEVTAATRDVLIESAYFNPPTVRRTAKRLGLSTEASYRFERGVDPDGVIHALERATQLMLEVGGGQAPSPRLDVYPAPIYRPRLSLRVSRVNEVLGTALTQPQVVSLLKRLHLPVVSLAEDALAIQVPSFRGDLEREIDLIEEVARLAGYDQIPVTLPRGELATPRPGPQWALLQEARRLLLGLGFFEAVTYSFQADRLGALLAGTSSPAPLRLANPLSEEQAMMRTSLWPGLLEALRRNTLKQVLDVRLFEASKVFCPEPGRDLPREELQLSGVMYGARADVAWNILRESVDFFDLKGAVETLLEGLLIPEVSFHDGGLPAYLRYGARIFSGEVELGMLGELQPEIGERLDLEGRIFALDLKFAALAQTAVPPLFEPLPRYPAIYRDLALVLPQDVPAAVVAAALHRYGRPWLEEARLFDVYAGDPIPPGKRSLAFRLTYRDPERTLTEELINPHHQSLVQALAAELGAELR